MGYIFVAIIVCFVIAYLFDKLEDLIYSIAPFWNFLWHNIFAMLGLACLALAVFVYIKLKSEQKESVVSEHEWKITEKIQIDPTKKEAEKRAKEMERKNELYQSAIKLFDESAREVNKAGSIPLIKELEYIYGGLTSDNLQSILSNSTWSEFEDVITTIKNELNRLKELGIIYQREELEEETKEEKAFRILSIPATARNDQIKKAYRTLAAFWHPDANAVADDTRIKEINWAYEFLKNNRGIK